MNRFTVIHRHEFGESIFHVQTELSRAELLEKYKDDDYDPDEGCGWGETFAKAIGCDFDTDFSSGETLDIYDFNPNFITL